MKCYLPLAALLAASLPAILGQPAIGEGAAVNNASYPRPGLPNAVLAQGSMAAIFGQRLAAGIDTARSFPLQTSMGGTSATLSIGGQTINLLMAYTTPGQIGAIIPSNAPTGQGTLTVSFNGTSQPIAVRVVPSAFGIFAVNQAGSGPAVVQNVNSETDRPVNALNKPARPRQTIIIWGTGLGPAPFSDANAPQAQNLNVNVEVYIGGKSANVIYKGRSGCCAGIDQLVVEVPDGVEGCYAPVVVKTGDIVSNTVSMSISRSGNVCSDIGGLTESDLTAVQQSGTARLGYISLSRFGISLSVGGINLTTNTESGDGSFFKYDYSNLLLSQGAGSRVGTINPGACTVFTTSGNETVPTPVDPIKPQVLNAGPAINITGPGGAKQLTRDAQTGTYSGQLSGSLPGGIPGLPGGGTGSEAYLVPGTYTFDNGTGGSDVGGFRTQITIPAALSWSNQAAISTVTRSAGQQITWTGGDPGAYVTMAGFSTSAAPRVSGGFFCTERVSAGNFTIPAYVLLSLPQNSGEGTGVLSVGSGSSLRASPAPSGLDALFLQYTTSAAKTVNYR